MLQRGREATSKNKKEMSLFMLAITKLKVRPITFDFDNFTSS